MSQVFIHCIAVAAMTVRAAIFPGVDGMPFTFPIDWIFYFMASYARGIRGVVATLSAGCGWEPCP
jgi:hypothetical protein